VNLAKFNQRALGIRSCENAFHLASTILGGRDIIEEFIAARVWPISSGWSPTELLYFNVNWADQKVPFPKFRIKLCEDQSTEAFMDEVEKRVNVMVGEYTMNEYKAYKALVKHKKRINRVFSEVCGGQIFQFSRPRFQVEGSCSCRGQLLSCPDQCSPNKVIEARLIICQRGHFFRGQPFQDKISGIVEAEAQDL
jgi:hypothetical protein